MKLSVDEKNWILDLLKNDLKQVIALDNWADYTLNRKEVEALIKKVEEE